MGQLIAPDKTPAPAVATEQAVARQTTEVQAMAVLARQNPRDEDTAIQKIVRSCQRPRLAADAIYAYSRGGKQITGPSVKLMQTLARHWGNLDYGTVVSDETEHGATVTGWAWDLQTNVRYSRSFVVERLQQRKQRDGTTQWVKPDERDWRELCHNVGSRFMRVALERIIPEDIIEEARAECVRTNTNSNASDPDENRRRILKSFGGLNVTADMLEQILGHAVASCSPDELTSLRAMYKSIADGEATISDFMPKSEPERVTVTPIVSTTSENRGHDRTEPECSEKDVNDIYLRFISVHSSGKEAEEEFSKASKTAGIKRLDKATPQQRANLYKVIASRVNELTKVEQLKL